MRSNLNRSKSQASSSSSSSSSSVSSVSSSSKGTSTTKEDASSIDDSRINKSTNTVEYHLVPSSKWVACDAAMTAATATTYAKELAKYRKSLYAKLKIQSVKARTYDVSLHPCHQCNRKKQHFLTCTKCHSVYCSKCLHDSGYEKGSGYVSQNSYVCPLCRKICKCAKCQAKDDGKPKARTRSRDSKSSDKGATTSKEKGKQSDSEWYYDVDEIEEIKNDGESEDDGDAAAAAEADTSADYVEEGDPDDDSDEELSDFSEGDEEEEEDEEVDDESNKTTEERAESKKKTVSNKQNSGGARRTDTRRNFRQPRHRDFSNDEIITPGIGVCIPKKVDIKIEVPPWRLIEESMYEGVEEESFDDSDEYYISIHEKMSRILDKENSKFIEPSYKKRRIAQPPRQPKVAEVKTGQSNGIKNEKSASHVNTRKKQQRPSRSYTSSDFIFDDETGLLGLNNGGNDDNDDGGKDIEGVHQRRYPQRKREPVQKGTKKTPSATPAAVTSASTSATRVQPARRIKAPTIALPKSVLNRKQQPHGALFGKSATSAAKTEKKPEKEKVEEKKAAVVNGSKKEADSSSNEEPGVRDVKHNESDEKHNKPKEVKKSAVPSFLSMDTSKTTNRTTTSQNDSIYTKMYNKIGSIVINAITSATPGMSSSSSSSSLQTKQKQPQQIIQKQQQSINQNQQIQSKNQIIQPQQINQQQQPQQQQPQQQFQQFQPTLQLPSYQPMQSSYYNQQLPYQQYSLPQSQPSQVGSLPVNNYTTFKNSNYNSQNNFGYGNYPQTSYQPSNRLYSSQQQVHNQQSMGPQYGGQQYENPWGSRQAPAYPNYRYAQEMCALCRVQEPSMMCPTCSAKLCSQRCYEVHYKNEHYFKYR